MSEEDESLILEEDYYQLLNVSRRASTEEINSAYRRLSRIFHPDKHNSGPNKKKWAEQIFNKVKQAYEVLSDSHKRAIYDTLGKKGLEVDGWEVIFRTRTPREIREEYERLKREREERRLQQRANPRGTINISINATDLFTSYNDEYETLEDSPSIPTIEVSAMSIVQSIDVPVNLRNTATISGNISTQNGTGNGSLTLSNRYLSSNGGWAEAEVGVGNGPSMGLKLFRTLSRHMFVNGWAGLHFTPRGISPNYASTIGLQLDTHSVSYLTYRKDNKGSSLTTTLALDTEKYHINAAIQIGIPHTFVAFNIIRKLIQYELKMRIAVRYGTIGAMVECGLEKKVSQNTRVAASVMLGVPNGVILKLKWSSSSQAVVVPIHLCEEIIPSAVFYAVLTPIVSWMIVKKLILDPIAWEQKERERQKTMELNFERLREMQSEARATVELMRETYSRIKSVEEKKNGLVIIKALYGKLEDENNIFPTETGDASPESPNLYPEVIDVTIPVQCLIRDSRLELLNASKSELPGFYDPCLGEEKKLAIQYLFHNNLHCCTVDDSQAVILPRNNHRVKNRS